jgi:hypothetical protein
MGIGHTPLAIGTIALTSLHRRSAHLNRMLHGRRSAAAIGAKPVLALALTLCAATR